MPRTSTAAALLALLATGCLDSHVPDSGRNVDGGFPPPDSGVDPRDAQVRVDGDVNDAGFVPTRCDGTPECYCFAEDPERGPSYCLTPFGESVETCEVGSGCDGENWLCNDVGWGERLGVDWHNGICIQESVCTWQRANDSRTRCYYEDGSVYETGVLSRDSCESVDRDLVCGPTCGGCGSEQVCVGVSERSGLGLCVRGTPSGSPDRCGPMHDECGDGQGCVGFVLSGGGSFATPESVWHACVQREACERLQVHYPDRFVCTR